MSFSLAKLQNIPKYYYFLNILELSDVRFCYRKGALKVFFYGVIRQSENNHLRLQKKVDRKKPAINPTDDGHLSDSGGAQPIVAGGVGGKKKVQSEPSQHLSPPSNGGIEGKVHENEIPNWNQGSRNFCTFCTFLTHLFHLQICDNSMAKQKPHSRHASITLKFVLWGHPAKIPMQPNAKKTTTCDSIMGMVAHGGGLGSIALANPFDISAHNECVKWRKCSWKWNPSTVFWAAGFFHFFFARLAALCKGNHGRTRIQLYKAL